MNFKKNLYTLLDSSNDEFRIKITGVEHMVFESHFPSNPILPAFLQIEIAEELIKQNFIEITRCKFLDLIRPLDTIVYKFEREKSRVLLLKTGKKIGEIYYKY